MQHSKSTVDEVLEAIADTILQCVMFQAEAEEAGARVRNLSSLLNLAFQSLLILIVFHKQLKNPDTGPLLAAMDFLSDLANKKAQLWAEYDKGMQQEMLKATSELQTATRTIVNDIATIANNPISKTAKKSLLVAAKTLMQRTVCAFFCFPELMYRRCSCCKWLISMIFGKSSNSHKNRKNAMISY